MTQLKLMSLNGEDMIQLIRKDGTPLPAGTFAAERGRLLGELIQAVDPDIFGLVEAPPSLERTQAFVSLYLGDAYDVHHAEKRGTLGIALLTRKSRGIAVAPRTKTQSQLEFELKAFDADGDGIKELYSWANRVPFECVVSGGPLTAPVTFVVIHAKSKGAFIPGDLYSYERLSRANRMKLRAQADAVRRRLDRLVDESGHGRVIVMGDMNDGPEFDIYAALLGGAFLEPIMGSVWDPPRVFHNPHAGIKRLDRWTIDFKDRVVNPLEASKYGQPTDLRSWIDHILLSPELKPAVVAGSAGIHRHDPTPVPKLGPIQPTDHHPPFVTVDL
jgi:Endonuclease/Exonuclease/phosphatase family